MPFQCRSALEIALGYRARGVGADPLQFGHCLRQIGEDLIERAELQFGAGSPEHPGGFAGMAGTALPDIEIAQGLLRDTEGVHDRAREEPIQEQELRGIAISSFGVSSVTASPEDEERIKQLQQAAALKDPTMAAAVLASAQAQASHSSTWCSAPGSGQSRVTRRISAYTPTLVSKPANSAEIGVQATW